MRLQGCYTITTVEANERINENKKDLESFAHIAFARRFNANFNEPLLARLELKARYFFNRDKAVERLIVMQ